jgi:hypothetical protein
MGAALKEIPTINGKGREIQRKMVFLPLEIVARQHQTSAAENDKIEKRLL